MKYCYTHRADHHSTPIRASSSYSRRYTENERLRRTQGKMKCHYQPTPYTYNAQDEMEKLYGPDVMNDFKETVSSI